MMIAFQLNGQPMSADLIPHHSCITALRNQFQCHSLGYGCQSADCGSCLILVDNNPILSCLLPTFELRRRDVWTMEGISEQVGFDDVVQGFKEAHAYPCPQCAPSRALMTEALLKQTLYPVEEQLVAAACSVRCDCIFTSRIIDAMRYAARQRAGRQSVR